MSSHVTVDRWQFTLTVMVHYVFPIITMGLALFGDQRHKMPNVTGVMIPAGVPGEAVRGTMLNDFGIEIGTSFGPLHGRIWRIGTMGYVCRKENVLHCLAALETALRRVGFKANAGAGVDAALAVYHGAEKDGKP